MFIRMNFFLTVLFLFFEFMVSSSSEMRGNVEQECKAGMRAPNDGSFMTVWINHGCAGSRICPHLCPVGGVWTGSDQGCPETPRKIELCSPSLAE